MFGKRIEILNDLSLLEKNEYLSICMQLIIQKFKDNHNKMKNTVYFPNHYRGGKGYVGEEQMWKTFSVQQNARKGEKKKNRKQSTEKVG